MAKKIYNLGKLIAELREYQESGAILLAEEEIVRCMSIARHHPAHADRRMECTHELITLHAGTCDRCGTFFVRPLGRKSA